MGFNFKGNNERKLYQSLITEAIEIWGIQIEYWRANRDPEKDKLYAEDTNPSFVDKFPMKAYFDKYFMEQYNMNKFGFQSPDATDMYISHDQWHKEMGEDTTPRAGDFVWLEYNNRVFIITTIEQEDHVFLQQKHTYRIHMVSAEVEGGTLTEMTSGDEALAIDNWPNQDPLEWDGATTNSPETSGIVVEKTNDVEPWGDW